MCLVLGKNVRGKNVRGNNVTGNNVRGKNVRGNNVRGNNVRGNFSNVKFYSRNACGYILSLCFLIVNDTMMNEKLCALN